METSNRRMSYSRYQWLQVLRGEFLRVVEQKGVRQVSKKALINIVQQHRYVPCSGSIGRVRAYLLTTRSPKSIVCRRRRLRRGFSGFPGRSLGWMTYISVSLRRRRPWQHRRIEDYSRKNLYRKSPCGSTDLNQPNQILRRRSPARRTYRLLDSMRTT